MQMQMATWQKTDMPSLAMPLSCMVELCPGAPNDRKSFHCRQRKASTWQLHMQQRKPCGCGHYCHKYSISSCHQQHYFQIINQQLPWRKITNTTHVPSILTFAFISFAISLKMANSTSFIAQPKIWLLMHLPRPYHPPKSNISHQNWGSQQFEGECWNVQTAEPPLTSSFVYSIYSTLLTKQFITA